MVVCVNESGGDVFALGVDDMGVFGLLKVAPDFLNFTLGDQQVVFFQHATFAAGPEGGIADEHRSRLEYGVLLDW